jgi:hypothetical protein
MTNVKIQMTNQIQMFKCLNDFVKNPDQRLGLFLPSARTAGLFAESGLPTESCFPFGKPKVCSIWGLRVQIPLANHHSAKFELFLFIKVKPITFLDFDF